MLVSILLKNALGCFGDPYTAWKVSKYGVFSGPYFRPYFPAFGLNTDQKKIRIWTLFTHLDTFHTVLIYLFQLSLEKRVFPDDIKIARVAPIYKAGDISSDKSNYRPVSVLPCFSKILERLMYNRLYKYLKESIILYENSFGFQSVYSTNDAIFQLVDKIFDSFEKEQFTLGVFIDLTKVWYSWSFHLTNKNWNFMA